MKQIVCFVGGGNMAAALIGSLVGQGWDPVLIRVVDPNADRCSTLQARYGVGACSDTRWGFADADIVVWAVKPQVLQSVIRSANGLPRQALHITVAAGVRLNDFSRWIGGDRVVRAMPNTPALVGCGISALLAGAQVSASDRQIVVQIFKPCGEVFWVDSDERLDAVTAVTGSGPGYVFYLLEGFASAAQALGFAADQSRRLALLTFQGAVKQALDGEEELALLRQRVTSKGGTTEAGLEALRQGKLHGTLLQAMSAACTRATELGTQLGSDREQPTV